MIFQASKDRFVDTAGNYGPTKTAQDGFMEDLNEAMRIGAELFHAGIATADQR